MGPPCSNTNKGAKTAQIMAGKGVSMGDSPKNALVGKNFMENPNQPSGCVKIAIENHRKLVV